MPISGYIRQLHGIVLKHSNKDHSHRGNYKPSSNKVVANYTDGTQRTLFEPTPPHLTPVEMPQLINWIIERMESVKYVLPIPFCLYKSLIFVIFPV